MMHAQKLDIRLTFIRIILPEAAYTVFLTLIVYRVFRFINYRFMDIARKESESMWVIK